MSSPDGKRLHPLLGQQVGEIMPKEIRTGGITGRVGSFGWTRVDAMGQPKQHKGIDLLATEGNPVYAAHNGRVRRCGWENRNDHDQGYGLRIYLEGSDDIETRYAHLSEILVQEGDLIRAGKILGRVGRTGNTGATIPTHLHFEVWHQDEPLDPELWLTEQAAMKGYTA